MKSLRICSRSNQPISTGLFKVRPCNARTVIVAETRETEALCTNAITFIVPGSPVGKGRPRFAKRGNFVQAFTPEKTVSYENLVRVKAIEAMRWRSIITGPVRLELSLFVTPPASWSNKKTTDALCGFILPTSKPDIDNVIKSICDAMNGIVFSDDKQVCDIHVTKRYARVAEARVKVEPIQAEFTMNSSI